MSTFALNNATLPYLLSPANKGLKQACYDSQAISEGVNTYEGHIVYPSVAEDQGKQWKDLHSLL